MKLQYESHLLPIEGENVHITRIFNTTGKPVVFFHGSIENGRVFYTESGKGIASYLARQGFDCYVVDLPGRGKSTPPIGKNASHDLPFYIERVIPSALDLARVKSGAIDVSIIAHSWGGVITLASIAIQQLTNISTLVFFGSKRRISVSSLKKILMVDLVWRFFGKSLMTFYKYYPARHYKIGSDNETTRSFLQTDQWVREKDWIYFDSKISIANILKEMKLPPLLSLTGSMDDVLGHPTDAKMLLSETGKQTSIHFQVVGKSTGFRNDYDHINLLTSKHSEQEVFPLVLKWMNDQRL